MMLVYSGGSESARYYYHYDGLGSVLALTDNAKNIVEQYRYDVFGTPTNTSTVGNRFLFTAREYDSETGLYYYRARYYKPSIGRFLQTDPIGYADSMNLYQYCLNNPVNWVDPYGENAAAIVAGSGAAAGASAVGAAILGMGAYYVGDAVGTAIADKTQIDEAIAYGIAWVYAKIVKAVEAANKDESHGNDNSSVNDNSSANNNSDKECPKEKTKREHPSKSRQKYEQETGEKWPKDPETGKNQDVSHKKPLADGGTNDVKNIEPKPHDEHIRMHKEKGDYGRWAQRKGTK